jgi:hypothetical protein
MAMPEYPPNPATTPPARVSTRAAVEAPSTADSRSTSVEASLASTAGHGASCAPPVKVVWGSSGTARPAPSPLTTQTAPCDMAAPMSGTSELMGPISTGIKAPSRAPVLASITATVLLTEFCTADSVRLSAASGEPMMASTQALVAPS